MESKSLRYNEEKPKWSLVHYKSLEPMVRVLEMGAKKYSPDNWKIGLNRSEILESTMRHLTALMDGELLDKESGISHMAHIQCNAMFYNYHEANDSFSLPKERPESVSKEVPFDYVLQSSGIHLTHPTKITTDPSVPTNKEREEIVDTLGWSERKKATFKFFNEFPEPYRTQAKDNYDETYASNTPDSKSDALQNGFSWRISPQGDAYWNSLDNTLDVG